MINRFTTRDKGLQQVLGHLEKDLLNYLWENGEATGRQIFDAVSMRRKNAYHTILTVLNRMVKKGLLSKEKKTGVFHQNTPDSLVKDATGWHTIHVSGPLSY